MGFIVSAGLVSTVSLTPSSEQRVQAHLLPRVYQQRTHGRRKEVRGELADRSLTAGTATGPARILDTRLCGMRMQTRRTWRSHGFRKRGCCTNSLPRMSTGSTMWPRTTSASIIRIFSNCMAPYQKCAAYKKGQNMRKPSTGLEPTGTHPTPGGTHPRQRRLAPWTAFALCKWKHMKALGVGFGLLEMPCKIT